MTGPTWSSRIRPTTCRSTGMWAVVGGVKHREFAMASGEMTDAAIHAVPVTSLTQIKAFTDDGAICFVCMDWRHIQQLLTAAAAFTLKNICVWVKNNGGMGSLYRSQHEFVVVLKCGAADHVNNVELGNTAEIGRTCGSTVGSTASVTPRRAPDGPPYRQTGCPGRRCHQGLLDGAAISSLTHSRALEPP